MDKREFARRRKKLMDVVDRGGIAIQPTAPERVRNRDVYYPYRSDSDFHYLTGFPEPEAVMVLVPDRPQGEYILFCREKDPEAETWHGRRAGLEGACELYGADDAFPISDLDDILPGLIENKERIYYTMGRYQDFDQRLLGWLNRVSSKSRAGVHTPDQLHSVAHYVHEMRMYKSREEIKTMRRAAQISAAAHRRAMEVCQPGLYEYQIEAELLHSFMRHGSRSPAYPSIVGGGANTCILHYNENNEQLAAGDLLLIDAGCELDHYASDITRTFPVNGRFTPAQRATYDIVCAAQQAAMQATVVGAKFTDPHDAAVRVLAQGLLDLGLIAPQSLEAAIESGAYKRFYMHRTGHWLGLDVHDVGDYNTRLTSGMVTTIEPGLYIRPAADIAHEFWNIGIRIEDDAAVTPNGAQLLTRGVPVNAADIEALMQR